MKGSPPQTPAGNNYNKFACLPGPVMEDFTLKCKDALLYEIISAQQDINQNAKPPKSDSEPEHFEYVDEYKEDKYIDTEGDTSIYMGSPTIYTGDYDPSDSMSDSNTHDTESEAEHMREYL